MQRIGQNARRRIIEKLYLSTDLSSIAHVLMVVKRLEYPQFRASVCPSRELLVKSRSLSIRIADN